VIEAASMVASPFSARTHPPGEAAEILSVRSRGHLVLTDQELKPVGVALKSVRVLSQVPTILPLFHYVTTELLAVLSRLPLISKDSCCVASGGVASYLLAVAVQVHAVLPCV
jgi:hypothetical protein